jgi:isocitrate dehydrogenase
MEVVILRKEKSLTVAGSDWCQNWICFPRRQITVLKESTPLKVGEIIDSSVMHLEALKSFAIPSLKQRKKNILLSVHLKRWWKFWSIILVQSLRYILLAYRKYATLFDDLLTHVMVCVMFTLKLLDDQNKQRRAAISEAIARAQLLPWWILIKESLTLHVPSDIIDDASMPAMIRTSGQMWNKDGSHKMLALIPRSFLRWYLYCQ